MKRNELLAWAAGVIGAAGEYTVAPIDGPTRKYMSFVISIPIGDSHEGERLMLVNDNGTIENGRWRLGGYAACRGFLTEVWDYMTPSSRSVANNAIKFFKEEKDKLKP